MSQSIVRTEEKSTPLYLYDAACAALAKAVRVDEVKKIIDVAISAATYARQAKNRQMEIDAMEIRLRAEREMGKKIKQMPKATGESGQFKARLTGGLSSNPPIESKQTPLSAKLSDLGIDKNLADRGRKLERIPEAEFEKDVKNWRASQQKTEAPVVLSKHNHLSNGTGENQWFTPREYIELSRRCLGAIDLDPASSDLAQKTVKAAKYFTAENDGLSQKWEGRVFLNPPYSRDLIPKFCGKLLQEIIAQRVSEAILLTHSYTDTAWFQTAATACSALCFTTGRIGFIDPEGRIASPTQGQAFIYFGERPESFIKHFKKVGLVVIPWHNSPKA